MTNYDFESEYNLKLIFAGIASKIGEELFQACAQYLAQVLQIKYGFVGEFIDSTRPQIKVLAFWSGDKFIPNFKYDIEGTPCSTVYETGLQIYPHSIQELFPEDQDLLTLEAESYLGISIVDSHGNNVGHVGGLDTKPLKHNYEQQTSILKVIATRSAAEIEHQLSKKALKKQNIYLQRTLKKLKKTQAQLIQAEKMSSLGEMVAGIAHEINNPVTFILGNLNHINNYTKDLLDLVHLLHKNSSNLPDEIAEKIEEIELDYIEEDLPKLLDSMGGGANRISKIVKSLQVFSSLDKTKIMSVDIHVIIDSILLILQPRLQNPLFHIKVIQDYGELPLVNCFPNALKQAIMNIVNNAIDALEIKFYKNKYGVEQPQIFIRTEKLENDWLGIYISDNGLGITEENYSKIFDPFFTTKPVSQGTGLGLSISYQIIVEQHEGRIKCISSPEKGAEFVIEIPT
ncbi:MAG: GAF domain-containing sensor histidine kinase [Okeania sp. SIO3B5]|uniref:ATP-binding protein n=1 Tax=Okeania sp. SIO3B5 TaxID=2607811 RepID=UPI0013FEF63C|nr:ATP-binding protein [Okeania sp. SIO3B5]NEO52833.1 GAF domain-containing sensor histidine kinase [Okeania sp. SIO3B5]